MHTRGTEHRSGRHLFLLLLSKSDITLSPTLLNVRGMRNIRRDTISTKLLAMGVPVNKTFRRHFNESRRLCIDNQSIKHAKYRRNASQKIAESKSRHLWRLLAAFLMLCASSSAITSKGIERKKARSGLPVSASK